MSKNGRTNKNKAHDIIQYSSGTTFFFITKKKYIYKNEMKIPKKRKYISK